MKYLETYMHKFYIDNFKLEDDKELYLEFNKLIEKIKKEWPSEKLWLAHKETIQSWKQDAIDMGDDVTLMDTEDNPQNTWSDISYYIQEEFAPKNTNTGFTFNPGPEPKERIKKYIRKWIEQYVAFILINEPGIFYEYTLSEDYKILIEGNKMDLL